MNNEATKLLKSDPQIRKCWMMFEALRRLGFESETIYFDHTGDESGVVPPRMARVVLRTQGREFIIDIGHTHLDQEEWAQRWAVVATAIAEREVQESVLLKIWDRSEFGTAETGTASYLSLITALHEKGFVVTLPTTPREDMN